MRQALIIIIFMHSILADERYGGQASKGHYYRDGAEDEVGFILMQDSMKIT